MHPADELSASMEDYLEAIYHIVSAKQAARAKDIAKRLEVNNSSVTGALRILSEKGYINYAPYDVITLTPKGHKHAEDVVRRIDAVRRGSRIRVGRETRGGLERNGEIVPTRKVAGVD